MTHTADKTLYGKKAQNFNAGTDGAAVQAVDIAITIRRGRDIIQTDMRRNNKSMGIKRNKYSGKRQIQFFHHKFLLTVKTPIFDNGNQDNSLITMSRETVS